MTAWSPVEGFERCLAVGFTRSWDDRRLEVGGLRLTVDGAEATVFADSMRISREGFRIRLDAASAV